MKATKQARDEAGRLFGLCVTDGLLDEGRAQQVLQQIVEIKPRGYLGMLWHFRRMTELYRKGHAAKVESATALAEDLRTRVQAELARLYGPGLVVSFAEVPALIGGMRIQVGSDVYDGSVQGRLSILQRSF
jgi:F-type H+-transporting ATPase subunit delta